MDREQMIEWIEDKLTTLSYRGLKAVILIMDLFKETD